MPICDACGQEHSEAFLHCRTCHAAGRPSDLIKVVGIADNRAELYCATCGLYICTAQMLPPPGRMKYPEGLPQKELRG